MTFTTVPINITGPTYQSRSRPLSSQLTVNMYQQFAEGGKDKFVLHSFPGQKLISSVVGTVDRGQHRMKEVQFKVVDKTLYQVDSAGVHVSKGEITGNKRCIFEDDGENLVIVSDQVFVFNSFNDTLVINQNINLTDVLSITIINNQFIYTQENISFMALPGDPFAISGLDGIGAESSPDRLVRDYVFNQTIYRFGVRTTEPWYNSEVGTPPIDRIEGQEFSVGLGAINSVANTDNAIYWLGDDKAIYRVSGGINERISTDGISNSIEAMTVMDDAFGYTFTLQGQDFYLITFPSEDITFVINEKLGVDGWFNLSSIVRNSISGGDKAGKYSGTSLLQVYDKIIVGSGGKNLELRLDEFTQDTDTMLRTRITSSINGELVGARGHEIKMSSIEFIMEVGVGLVTGQGEVPKLMIEASYDGGRSFAEGDWVEIGRAGEYTLRVEWFNMMTFTDLILRITISDPVPVSIYSAAIDLKLAGR